MYAVAISSGEGIATAIEFRRSRKTTEGMKVTAE